jgi:hypothetical protein
MKIQVTGNGSIMHGIGEDENHVPQSLKIPPGIHVTSDEDPSSLITPELADYLIASTHGHVIEYIPPDPKTTQVEQVATAPSMQAQMNETLAKAQAAQKIRFDGAKAERDADPNLAATGPSKTKTQQAVGSGKGK